MCVLVCVWVGGVLLIIFYSPQAHMKRAWNPLLLQIYITEQCESLFKKTDHLWKAALTNNGFDGWTEWIQSFFRLNVNQSITWCRWQFSMLFILYNCLNGNVTTHFFIFFIFHNWNTSASEYIFLLTIFSLLYWYTLVHEIEKCTLLRSYIYRSVNVGAELNVYGNVS